MNGKEYVASTIITDNPEITFTHVATNNSSSEDTVSFSVSRTKKFSGTLSGTVEASALITTCKISSEVTYGTEKKVSTTCTWSVPPYKSVVCRYGSAVVNTTGKMKTWFNGSVSSTKTVSSVYTYASYSDKTEQ